MPRGVCWVQLSFVPICDYWIERPPKGFSLRRGSAAAALPFINRFDNGYFVAYTSSERLKPPTFSSRRRLLVGCIFQHMQTVAFPAFSSLGEGFHSRAFSSCMADIINYRSQPRLLPAPNHARRAADSAAGRKGWRSQTEGGKQGAPGGKLAFIRAVQAFTCPAGVRGSFQFYFSSFSVHNTGSLVLS